jgi:transcription initiation factor TFIIB
MSDIKSFVLKKRLVKCKNVPHSNSSVSTHQKEKDKEHFTFIDQKWNGLEKIKEINKCDESNDKIEQEINEDEDIFNLFEKFKLSDTNGNDSNNKKIDHLSKDGKMNIKYDTLTCPYCSSEDVILENGSYTCQSCNAMICQFIDVSAEWRNFGDDKGADTSRCGMPVNDLLPTSSMGSMIGYAKKDNANNRKIRMCQLWASMPYVERKLYNSFEVLNVNATTYGIPKMIVDDAKTLYKQFSEIKTGRGHNKNSLIASSLYFACKRNNVPRSAKEVAKVFNIKPTFITNGCKLFQESMGIIAKSSSGADYIARFCSPFNLDQQFQDICKDVVQCVEMMDIASDNTPPSLAVGVICFCCDILKHGIDKKRIAQTCDISQITITKCCQKIELHKDEIIEKCMITN